MHMHGHGDKARVALHRCLSIAEEHGDLTTQLRPEGILHMFHFRCGEFKVALDFAQRYRGFSETLGDPAAIPLSHYILGSSLHLMGDLRGARAELETSLEIWSRPQPTRSIYRAFERHFRASSALARTLWLQGHPAQAMERAHHANKDAERFDHPVSLVVVLAWTASIFLWVGDLEHAEELIDSCISHSESHSLGPHLAVARCRKAELSIRRGDARDGVERLRAGLDEIHAFRYELLTTEFNISLVQGLAGIGRFAEGLSLIDETIRRVETDGDVTYMPELLRVKAGLLLSMATSSRDDAEACLLRSLELSRRHGARAWELRTATDLATLWAAQGRFDGARALLHPVFEQFTEGFDTADLKAARRLLATWN